MKIIKLQGINCLYTFVDDEDYEELIKFKWYGTLLCGREPVYRYIKAKERHLYNVKNKLLLHRILTNTVNSGKNIFIDHKDGNPLNNQKSNLRLANSKNNCYNRGKQANNKSSNFKGVTFDKANNKYKAQIRFNRTSYNIGRFENPIDAAKAYNNKASELFGEFARLNVID